MATGLIFAALILAAIVLLFMGEQKSPFVPVMDVCGSGAPVYSSEPTVRDGSVAPLAYNDIANMVRRDLGVRSGGVAAYAEYGASPELGLGRLLWSRALPAQLRGAQGAQGAQKALPVDVAGDPYELTPGMPGTLVPEDAVVNDRPMSLPYWSLAAARSNPDFAPDGPFGAAVQAGP